MSQSPGLLQTLQQTVAEPEDIFYVNFGRWHFSNCQGLQAEPYALALWNMGKLYEVISKGCYVMLHCAYSTAKEVVNFA
jgi:hypothetical protein